MTLIKSIPQLREALQDNRTMLYVEEFSENPPDEKLIALDWEAAVAVSHLLAEEYKTHRQTQLNLLMARVTAWSILNQGRLPVS